VDPVVLIHGYGAESAAPSKAAIPSIYGDLPARLRRLFGGAAVVEIDLSRYVSLEDGVTIDDLSRALDRALREEFSHLLAGKFHVVAHSTGALVIRNWIRRFSRKPSPAGNVVYLAGANFGSGWGHIGKGQIAKWGRAVFQSGAERGLLVLGALELGSEWTLDLHRHFLKPGSRMAQDYRVQESSIIGSQADVAWYLIPIRYAKEDGSDGVVRVASGNINFHYLRFAPTARARSLSWKEVPGQAGRPMDPRGDRLELYEIKEQSRPGLAGQPEAPFAIPFECSHSGPKMGVVGGDKPGEQVLRLVASALGTPPNRRAACVQEFHAETAATYRRVLEASRPAAWKRWIDEPRAQYDPHAQVIVRVRDQDGRPVSSFDVFFDSVQGARDTSLAIRRLFQDKHRNSACPHIITFYLRTDAFNPEAGDWEPQIPKVQGCHLEVSAVEPETSEIVYLPMRFEFTAAQLEAWVRGHRSTLVDVELLRLPSPELYKLARYR